MPQIIILSCVPTAWWTYLYVRIYHTALKWFAYDSLSQLEEAQKES